ncbi:MAG: TlpA disulfide reductase family protein [Bdellovibrionales bacterium]|nr:TlpA disulfide reductase family protein [Bdellovibrionales bacterium]
MLKKRPIIIWTSLSFAFFVLLFIFSSQIISIFQKPTSKKSYRLNKIESLTEQPIHWIVRDIYGKTVEISKGKNLVINLWATWCAPCIEELPSLSLLAEKMNQKGLVVALTTEPLEKVKRFVKTSFPDLSSHLKVVSVTEEERSQFFPADNLPVTYLFNQKGLLMDKVVGARDWNTFQIPEKHKP